MWLTGQGSLQSLVCRSSTCFTLPPGHHGITTFEAHEGEDEESAMDPTWPHLQIEFEFLLWYVVSPDTDAMVAKRYFDRSFVIRFLDRWTRWFALPFKEEHKVFLVRALLPLHEPNGVSVYHQQLSYCIIGSVEKDFKLADIVIRGLL